MSLICRLNGTSLGNQWSALMNARANWSLTRSNRFPVSPDVLSVWITNMNDTVCAMRLGCSNRWQGGVK